MGTGKTKLASSAGKRSVAPRSAGANQANTQRRSRQPDHKNPGGGGKKSGKTLKRAIFTALGILIILTSTIIALWSSNVKPPSITPVPTPNVKPVDKDGDGLDDNTDAFGEQPDHVMTGRKEDFYTVMLAGTNEGLSDIIMVASFDNKNKEINVISIPRDTYVTAKRSVAKINGAYNSGGVELLLDEVESVIGFRPDNYAIVDYEGFRVLVDTIGGVQVDVPIDMFHRDDDGEVDINLKKGPAKLDGNKALQFVRFRNTATGEDLGRISRTQYLLTETIKQTVKLSNITKVNEFANIFVNYVETDLEVGEIVWFGQQALSFDAENDVHFETLPIQVGWYKNGSYVFVEKKESIELINSTINPYTTDIKDTGAVSRSSLSSGSSGSTGSTTVNATPTPPPASTPTPPPDPDPATNPDSPDDPTETDNPGSDTGNAPDDANVSQAPDEPGGQDVQPSGEPDGSETPPPDSTGTNDTSDTGGAGGDDGGTGGEDDFVPATKED